MNLSAGKTVLVVENRSPYPKTEPASGKHISKDYIPKDMDDHWAGLGSMSTPPAKAPRRGRAGAVLGKSRAQIGRTIKKAS
jgi:hypothetical protein